MGHDSTQSTINRIGFIGNYLPRQCGIATFTTDLCEAIATEYGDTTCIALPVNDIEAGYAYPPRVRFELAEKDIRSYRRAADFLNINSVDLVCLQHEYGIFGGPAGSHILALLRELRTPIVTTLHTILQEPSPAQRRVLQEVAALSDRVVVMSERGVEFLQTVYGVLPEKIDLIPHGIPDVSFVDPSFHKDLFGVEGKMVLLSFGLLSANKGIETVIAALPAIVARYPDVVYIIVGATHPHVLRQDGETYRLSLQRLAQELGVAGNVIFYNRFVSLERLIEFISAADIYITPYLNPAQITSGTLAYTLGAGKAVISTPYWYAEEMLADDRGALVPFRDPAALVEQVIDLLDHESKRHAMRKRAYLFGRAMIWPQVAQCYMESFERARAERRSFIPSSFAVKPLDQRPGELPPLKLDHLHHMTDDTGMIQHATFIVPNYYEGYSIDDNARALIVSTHLAELELGNGEALALASRYLAFINYAFNHKTGRFRNFMDYQRRWLEESGSEDSHGRTLWALGTVLGRSNTPSLQSMASWLFEQALPAILETTSPRAWAFTLIGIHEYLRRFDGDRRASQVRDELAGRLLTLYQNNRSDDWQWYENELTYCNAILPQAMLMCGQWIPNRTMTQAGLQSLSWLADLQHAEAAGGHFVPIGSNGFYERDGERARFDQQPVEAQTMASACLEAYRSTGDERWRTEAQRAFEWFLGRNDLNLPLYDPTTGGCRDGLHSDRPNENQGAESTLAFLQTLLELRLAENPFTIYGDPNLMNQQHPEFFRRHKLNPILTAADWPYPIHTVFNPAATLLPNGMTLLLCRVEDRRGHSHLCVARSVNGVDEWQIDPQPTFLADPDHFPEELWGIEDPRITYVPELGRYAVVYTAFTRDGPGVALALTEDFHHFERYGLIMAPDDKDAALLPHRIGGHWALIHRPVSSARAHMWISYSADLWHWGSDKLMLEARRGAWWDANKIGLSPPPIETAQGWLVIYHGVRQTASGSLYRLGLALFDLEIPECCLKRGDEWVFGPEAPYELHGDVGNVVFPCGYTILPDGDTLHLYYGAGDTSIALATGSVRTMLEWLDQHG